MKAKPVISVCHTGELPKHSIVSTSATRLGFIHEQHTMEYTSLLFEFKMTNEFS